MSATKNYDLALTDNDQTKFKEWRESINGNSNSNMEKIDTALGEKANLSVAINAVLLMSAWSDDSPYVQTISVEGLTADQNGIITIGQNITTEQLEDVVAADMRISDQADGSLTVTAYGDKPTRDIPVTIILLG
ncbi:hypothetical protein [Flintibacter muris]|uniref:hypothetical protein n=1 Tax=Flintibacter muris TaxID=2941327 RepID=UPI00203DDED2|nr:hypothetical protein [Flintibacter muris]